MVKLMRLPSGCTVYRGSYRQCTQEQALTCVVMCTVRLQESPQLACCSDCRVCRASLRKLTTSLLVRLSGKAQDGSTIVFLHD